MAKNRREEEQLLEEKQNVKEEYGDEEGEDEEGEDPGEYEVEKILNHKKIGKDNYEYFVHWLGYPSSDDSWVPAENMACDELVTQYWEEHRAKEQNKKKNAKASKPADTPQQPAVSARSSVVFPRDWSAERNLSRQAKSGARPNYRIDLEGLEEGDIVQRGRKRTRKEHSKSQSKEPENFDEMRRMYEGVDPNSIFNEVKNEPEPDTSSSQTDRHENPEGYEYPRPMPLPKDLPADEQAEYQEKLRASYPRLEQASNEILSSVSSTSSSATDRKEQKESLKIPEQKEEKRLDKEKLSADRVKRQRGQRKETVPPLVLKRNQATDPYIQRRVEEAMRAGPSNVAGSSSKTNLASLSEADSSSSKEQNPSPMAAPVDPADLPVEEQPRFLKILVDSLSKLEETHRQEQEEREREEADNDLLDMGDDDERTPEQVEEAIKKERLRDERDALEAYRRMDPWQKGCTGKKIELIYDAICPVWQSLTSFVMVRFTAPPHSPIQKDHIYTVSIGQIRRKQPSLLQSYETAAMEFMKEKGIDYSKEWPKSNELIMLGFRP